MRLSTTSDTRNPTTSTAAQMTRVSQTFANFASAAFSRRRCSARSSRLSLSFGTNGSLHCGQIIRRPIHDSGALKMWPLGQGIRHRFSAAGSAICCRHSGQIGVWPAWPTGPV